MGSSVWIRSKSAKFRGLALEGRELRRSADNPCYYYIMLNYYHMMRGKRYYENKQIRLKGWDYRTPAWYFITIITKNRQHFFGEICNGIVGLSEMGCKAYQNWEAIPNHFDHIKLDAFIVMPNHMHGLLGIMRRPVRSDREMACPRDLADMQSDRTATRKFGPLKSGSISSIMQAYKASVTREARKSKNYIFGWHSRFHDHIVRNKESFNRIRNYIINNPRNWSDDRFL